MDIFSDIEKITHIPCKDKNVSFVHVRGSIHPAHDKRKHKRTPAKNENLYDIDTSESYDHLAEELFNRHEIYSSIREANGGLDYSNSSIERNHRLRKFENLTLSENCCNSKDLMTEINYNNNEVSVPKVEADAEPCSNKTKAEVLEKCKLSRNAVISGLLKSDKITVKDLRIPNNASSTSTDAKQPKIANIQANKVSSDEDRYRPHLVPHPEDPEILVQPLQAYGTIDEKEYKEIDFIVPHIGKKKVVTSRRYYLEMDDSDLNFRQ